MYDDLKREYDALQNENNELKSQISNSNNFNNSDGGDGSNLTSPKSISEMKDKLTKAQNTVRKLRSQSQDSKKEIILLKKEISNKNNEIIQLNDIINNLKLESNQNQNNSSQPRVSDMLGMDNNTNNNINNNDNKMIESLQLEINELKTKLEKEIRLRNKK